jgi:hypothetical protein
MAKKFADMKVGEQFEALGERYVKSGELTYRSLDNPTMGEYNAGPILDRQIGVQPKGAVNNAVKVTKDPELESTDAAVQAGLPPLKGSPVRVGQVTPKETGSALRPGQIRGRVK